MEPAPGDSEFVGVGTESAHDELDVFAEVHSEQLGADAALVAFHLRCERLVLQLLLDAPGAQTSTRPSGRTRQHATMNPVSSSQARSALSIGAFSSTPHLV